MKAFYSNRRAGLLLFLLIGAFLYYRYGTASGILARYGVYFDDDTTVFASPSLNEVGFWFEGPHGKLPGPEIMGDLLYVERPYHTDDGHLEFAVQAKGDPSKRVRISLMSPPHGDRAFHVHDADARKLNVHYPHQGIRGWP